MGVSAVGGAGLVGALGLVLALAGAAKVRDGAQAVRAARALGVRRPVVGIRLLAAAELACGALALAAPSRLSAAIIAVFFGGFAVASWRLRAIRVDCGCFGGEDRGVVDGRQIALNIVAASSAAGLALAAPPSVLLLAGEQRPGAVVAAGLIAVTGVAAVRRLFAAGGVPSERAGMSDLVDASARQLEHRISRRSALVRLTVAGSAFCIAPWRYLVYPEPAMAVIVPGRCGSGLCNDGYTAFCCEINHGRNECPAGTFVGGWWMCTDYPGNRLCAQQGVRYYIDCNRIPGRPFAGGCHCANGSCANRAVSCNVFRYGQCNTQVVGTTEVVCRVVTCTNPSLDSTLNCGSHLSIDNAVCGHDVHCLGNKAAQLPGAGGV